MIPTLPAEPSYTWRGTRYCTISGLPSMRCICLNNTFEDHLCHDKEHHDADCYMCHDDAFTDRYDCHPSCLWCQMLISKRPLSMPYIAVPKFTADNKVLMQWLPNEEALVKDIEWYHDKKKKDEDS